MRLRSRTMATRKALLADLVSAWSPNLDQLSLRLYTEAHGISHLLDIGRREEAQQALLDWGFLAAMNRAHEHFSHVLGAWRILGTQAGRAGYAKAVEAFGETGDDKALGDAKEVAIFFGEAGWFEVAQGLMKKVGDIVARRAGSESEEAIEIRSLMHYYEGKMGRPDRASAGLKQVIYDQLEHHGHINPYVTVQYIEALKEAGQLAEAEREVRGMLRGVELRPDLVEDPAWPAVKSKIQQILVHILQDQGRTTEARQIEEQRQAEHERPETDADLTGADLQTMVAAQNTLAIAQMDTGAEIAAHANSDAAFQQARALLGDEHATTITVRKTRAMTLKKQGRYREALEEYEAVLALQRANPVMETSVAITLNDLGMCYLAMDETAQAVPLLRQAWSDYTERFGPHAGHSLTMAFNLGTALEKAGQLDEAETTLLAELDGVQSSLGPGHESAIKSLTYLMVFYVIHGNPNAADEIFRLHAGNLTDRERHTVLMSVRDELSQRGHRIEASGYHEKLMRDMGLDPAGPRTAGRPRKTAAERSAERAANSKRARASRNARKARRKNRKKKK